MATALTYDRARPFIMESQAFRLRSQLQVQAAPDALLVLRSRTLVEHRAVEAQLELLDPALTLDGYARDLQSFYGFWKPLEARLATTELARLPSLGLSACQRTAWLEQDLRALGRWRPDVELCRDLPGLETRAGAWGCLYVLEGAALGGRVIAKHVRATIGVGPHSGARFFTGRGEHTATHWRTVQEHLREALAGATSQEQGVNGALATFRCLRAWLVHQAR